jgi:PleD family two-component response regulator
LAEGGVRLSLAAGVAFATEACDSPEELLKMADRAMYAAKRSAAVVKSRER